MKKLKSEEAITILKDMKVDIPVPKAGVTQIKRNAAIEMAIDALKAQADGDTISRKAVIDRLKREEKILYSPAGLKYLVKAIESLPSAQPNLQPTCNLASNDCISRQAAVDAMGKAEWAKERLRELPSAQPEVLACGEGELIAQPEIVRCKDCKYWNDEFAKDKSTCWLPCMSMTTHRKWYCGSAERRTDDGE